MADNDNFGFYTYHTVDSQPVCDIYVDTDTPKTQEEAQQAAHDFQAAHPELQLGYMIAPVHAWPGSV